MFSKAYPLYFWLLTYLCFLLPTASYAKTTINASISPEYITTLFTGTIEGQQSVDLRAMQAGRIISLSLLNGSSVQKGDIIAEIYAPELADNLHQAQANYREKQANRIGAQKEWHRAKSLYQQGLLALATVDDLEASQLAAKASVAVAQAQVDSSHKRYQERLVRAPFSGLVRQLYVRQGEYLNVGQSVLALDEIKRQKARFILSERYAIALSLGQQLTLTIPVLGEQQPVVITELSRPKQGASRLFEVTVALSQARQDLIGLQAQLSITSTTALYRVKQSLLNYNLAGAGYIFDDNKQQKIAVSVEAINGDYLLLHAISAQIDLAACCLKTVSAENDAVLALIDSEKTRGLH